MMCKPATAPLVRIEPVGDGAQQSTTRNRTSAERPAGMTLARPAIPSAERGGEVLDQILGRLEADREPHQPVGDALAAADRGG